MQKRTKSLLIMLVPSVIIWFLGIGIIIISGIIMGQIFVIIGAVFTYITLYRLVRIFADKDKNATRILLIVLTLFFLINIFPSVIYLVDFLLDLSLNAILQ